METRDGENSSDGIIASSDDELVGLSRAVEHHLHKEETATLRHAPGHTSDTDWRRRSHARASYDDMHSYEGHMSGRSGRDLPPHNYSRSLARGPYFPAPQPLRPSLPYMFGETYHHASAYDYRPDFPMRVHSPPPLRRGHFPPQKGYYAPRTDATIPWEVDHLQHAPLHTRARRVSLSPPRQIQPHSLSGLQHGRPLSPGPPRPRISCSSRPPLPSHHEQNFPRLPAADLHGSDDYNARDMPFHTGQYQSHDRVQHDTHYHFDSQRNKNYLPNSLRFDFRGFPRASLRFPPPHISDRSTQLNLENAAPCPKILSNQSKPPPKPISFKIKSIPPSKRQHHPLDPLSNSAPKKGQTKASSPTKWSHDKYEELTDLHTEKKSPHQNSSFSDKNLEEPKRKRFRSETRTTSGNDANMEHEFTDEDLKKPRIERACSEGRSEECPENNDRRWMEEFTPTSSRANSTDEGLGHMEREEETVYEEEIVVLDELDEADGAALPEEDVADSEDDEELLDLRRQALTSALNMENRAKQEEGAEQKKKTMPKRRKPKRILRRVRDSPPRSKGRRPSEVADVFLRKHRSIAKRRTPERLRKVVSEKPSTSQLTLVGEIIKNHQPPPRDTLRLIRSLPDEEKKTAMFLKLMKHDQLNHSEVTELYKEVFTTKKKDQSQPKPAPAKAGEQIETKEPPPKKDTEILDGDDYEEIEMDVEDEGSDSNLVPPGTTPIALPKTPPKSPVSPYSPTRAMACVADSDKAKSPVYVPSTSMTLTTTPSQESIWSMLERSVETGGEKSEVESKAEDDVEVADIESVASINRRRVSSEEMEFDDDALLKLRATLISQIDKQKEIKKDVPEEFGTGPPSVSDRDREMVPLPSQFPYQPPTLPVASISAVPVPVAEPNLFLTPSPAGIVHLAPVAHPAILTSGSNPIAVPQAASLLLPNCSILLSQISAPADVGSMLSLDVESGAPPAFQPQMVSTPALRTAETPLSVAQLKRRRKRRQSPSKKRSQNEPANVGEAQENKSDNVTSDQLGNVAALRPAVTNITSTPSTLFPAEVKAKLTAAAAIFDMPSHTVVKTATTLIKTNVSASKQPRKTSSQKATAGVSNMGEKPSEIRLPRHQPVVISLGDSSDEESILSPGKGRTAAKNPSDLHKDMLEAMIRQVREQTTANQKGKTVAEKNTPEKQKPVKARPEKRKPDETCSDGGGVLWPFVATLQPGKQSPLKTLDKLQEKRTGKQGTTLVNSPKEIRRADVQTLTTVATKSIARQQKNGALSDADDKTNALANELKQSRSKFLKLRDLIGKDKISFRRVSKIKDTKRAELKIVEDELKEMMYRVAAIKGKKARCEELAQRYDQQELKIKDRLNKRCALKLKLEEQIKQQYLKVRAERRARKSVVAGTSATAKASRGQIAKAAGSSSNPSSPAKARTQERLDKEKQRLLAVEQKLAVKISKMKKTESVASKVGPRRASLSKEVQSHLAKYRKTRRPSNPSAHDLSLSKIAISSSSPVRPVSQSRGPPPVHENSSPVKKLLQSSAKVDKVSSPKKPARETPSKAAKISSANDQVGLEQWQPTSKGEVTTGSDAIQKVQEIVRDSMLDLKEHLSSALHPFVDLPFSSKAWEERAPDCFKTWKLDAGDVHVNKGEERRAKSFEFQNYESPLRAFRSYRLNPFLRTKEKLSVKSKTFSHKINPRQIFCRYDLSGTCQDRDCKAQHTAQYELSSGELIYDLVSYCPVLLGKEAKSDANYEDLLKISQAASDKLCGITSAKNSMSVDEKCVLIASKVNGALGNKPPCTTIFKPRTLKPRRKEDSWKVATIAEDVADDTSDHKENPELLQDATPQHPDLFVKDDERYFLQNDSSAFHELELAVKEHPHDTQLWLELAYRKLKKHSTNEQNRLELALHTMCLALEENPYDGELWAHYLGLLHHRRGAQSDDDLDEMVSQAIELVPLSTHIWNQLFSWECNVLKREFLYDKLIGSLIKNLEEGDRSTLPSEAVSRWLLQTVLRRVHLLLHRNSVEDVLPSLEGMARHFSQQCKWARCSERRCMTAEDLNSLWIAFINLKHFGTLPDRFQPDPRPKANVTPYLGVKVIPGLRIRLHIEARGKLSSKMYEALRSDLNGAIGESTPAIEPSDMSCLVLLRERLSLEAGQEQWEFAIATCNKLCEALSEFLCSPDQACDFSVRELEQLETETTVILADALIKNNKNNGLLEATQVFDAAITKRSSNARLCYEAASFQLSLETVDMEAALLYFETCSSAFLKTEKENMSRDELKKTFRRMLRLPVPLDEKPPSLLDGKSWDDVNEEKAYLWLLFCRILQLDAESDDAIADCYEKAIDDVKTENDRKEVWLRYLRFRQTTGTTVGGSGSQTMKARQAWLKNFTLLVRRCLTTVSPQLPADEFLAPDENEFCDHAFHNQVAAIYLSSFHTRQQLASAYNFLTESMPYNVALLLKACRFFLNFGDHHSVISITWKITSSAACRNKAVWKISMASHFATGRIAKAMRLSKQAIKAIPYSVELWSDYLALLKAYGKAEDLIAENIRCSSYLQIDAARLLSSAT